MILDKNNLLSAIRANLAKAVKLDIAVAWASGGDGLKAVLDFAARSQTKPRVIVGTSANCTTPLALRKLAACCDLKLTSGATGIFHPKVYCFHHASETIAWVGSANLSKRGFGMNDEAVHQFRDGDGSTSTWFENLWNSLPLATPADIDAYCQNWKPPGNVEHTPTAKDPGTHPFHLLKRVKDWPGYVSALHQCDAYWAAQGWHFSVLGERSSYLETIIDGHEVVLTDDWSSLTKEDVKILMGSSQSYGLLGSMRGAGKATNTFLEASPANLKVRKVVQKAIQPLKTEAANVPQLAAEAIGIISEQDRFNSGVATRLITLMRPDSAVSVNTQSKVGLAELSGLPVTTLGTPKNYRSLLEWVQSQPWHHAPPPKDPAERMIWNMRAALLDSFVYGYKP